MSESEKRKAERKKKKAEAKKETGKGKGAGGKETATTAEKKADPDADATPAAPLDPAALLKTPKPLDEAVKFLLPLIELKTANIDAYILGFNVYWRKVHHPPSLCHFMAPEWGGPLRKRCFA